MPAAGEAGADWGARGASIGTGPLWTWRSRPQAQRRVKETIRAIDPQAKFKRLKRHDRTLEVIAALADHGHRFRHSDGD